VVARYAIYPFTPPFLFFLSFFLYFSPFSYVANRSTNQPTNHCDVSWDVIELLAAAHAEAEHDAAGVPEPRGGHRVRPEAAASL
jgi:hypothetical protein